MQSQTYIIGLDAKLKNVMFETVKGAGLPKDPYAARAYATLQKLLHTLGLEVGDYGHPFIFVQTKEGMFQVRLEGWGEACVRSEGKKAKKEALKEALALAAAWYTEGWPFTGVAHTDDTEVWEVTWAVNGPLKSGALPDDTLEEEIVDLR